MMFLYITEPHMYPSVNNSQFKRKGFSRSIVLSIVKSIQSHDVRIERKMADQIRVGITIEKTGKRTKSVIDVKLSKIRRK